MRSKEINLESIFKIFKVSPDTAKNEVLKMKKLTRDKVVYDG